MGGRRNFEGSRRKGKLSIPSAECESAIPLRYLEKELRGETDLWEQAIFHEGSKGYLCCKRRVLEFDEFMKIAGCTTGKHLFVGSKKDEVSDQSASERGSS